MDKIWDRNPSKSEDIGRCGGDEKNEWSRRTDKSRTLKKKEINYVGYHSVCVIGSPVRQLCQTLEELPLL